MCKLNRMINGRFSSSIILTSYLCLTSLLLCILFSSPAASRIPVKTSVAKSEPNPVEGRNIDSRILFVIIIVFGIKVFLLYSWCFSRYSAPIHWLVHGHMTSNNETVSRQMPWAGHIAKTMSRCQTRNSSLLPAKCWPLLHVIAGIPARFSNFAFVLFCYITNHLITGPLGNSH